MTRTWRVLGLVASAPLSTLAGCNLVFSLDGYEGPEVSADGGGWCPSGAVFCDDFERSADDLQGEWASIGANGGQLSIVSGTPTGNALSCRLPAGDGQASAYLATTASAAVTKRVIASSRVRISSPIGAGSINVNALSFVGVTGRSLVFPIIQAPGLIAVGEVVCDGGCQYAQTQPVSLPADAWVSLSLVVDFSAVPARYSLKIDDMLVIDAAPSALGAQPGTLEFHAGIETSQVHADFEVSVDDLVISAE